jgi:beta-fructofuranosidase
MHLDDHWAWDFWLADDGERYHLYFLKAPTAIGDPNERHWNVRVGHAVSGDLIDWEVVDDAFGPSEEPAFDDYTTWTGSVVRAGDGTWCMFYTGTSRAERGLKQRIGLATSTDLHTWRKHGPEALVASDPRWYEQLGDGRWHDEAWRDPWVFRDPAGDGWHMLITARARTGTPDQRGVLGHARSRDLLAWEVMPPLSAPGAGFGHLEVPQVETVHGRPVVLFSCLGTELAEERRAAGERGGVWLVQPEDLLGPYDPSTARRLTDETLYSGRLVRDRRSDWVMLAFHYDDRDAGFVGQISDPIPFDALGTAADPFTVVRSAKA